MGYVRVAQPFGPSLRLSQFIPDELVEPWFDPYHSGTIKKPLSTEVLRGLFMVPGGGMWATSM